MTSQYIPKPRGVPKAPKGQKYCHGHQANCPQSEFVKRHDPCCKAFPVKRVEPRPVAAPPPKTTASSALPPAFKRWICGPVRCLEQQLAQVD